MRKIFKKLAFFFVAILSLTVSSSYSVKEVRAEDGTKTYAKVTSALSDWTGEYLIVYEDGEVAFNGGLAKLDAVSNTISVEISDGKIVANDTTNAAKFTVAKSGSSYTVKSASGYYIGQTSNNNGLASNTSTTYDNTISLNDDKTVNLVSKSAYLRFNSDSNQNRFRYYKSSSYTGQKAICLYKLVESSGGGDVTPDPEEPVVTPIITLDTSNVSVKVGETATVNATINDGCDINKIAWTSSNDNVAKVTYTVDGSESIATIEGVAAGNATITASIEGGEAKTVSVIVESNSSQEPEQPTKSLVLNFKNEGYQNAETVSKIEKSPLSFLFSNNGGSTPPKYYESGEALRVYANNKIEITSNSAYITRITFNCVSQYNLIESNVECNEGGNIISNNLWEGTSKNVSINNIGSSQIRIISLTVEYYEVLVPSISFSENTLEVFINKNKEILPIIENTDVQNVIWNSSDESIATIENGIVHGISIGTTIISASIKVDEEIYTADILVIVKDERFSYSLATDISQLSIGNKIVIAASDSDYAMSTEQKTNNRGQSSIFKTGSEIVFSNNIQIFTLEKGNAEGTFAFKTDNGYLYAAGNADKENYLRTETELSDNSSWKISINEGIASIVAQGENTRNVMQYNQSSSLFSCYPSTTTTMKPISLYKLTYNVEPLKTTNIDAQLNFGYKVEDNIHTRNMYAKETVTSMDSSKNYASALGLNEDVFNVTGTADAANNYPTIKSDSYIKISGNTTLNSKIIVSSNYVIKSIEFTALLPEYDINKVSILVNDAPAEVNENKFEINAKEFVITPNQDSGFRFNNLSITYQEKDENTYSDFSNFQIKFTANIPSNLDSLFKDNISHYGFEVTIEDKTISKEKEFNHQSSFSLVLNLNESTSFDTKISVKAYIVCNGNRIYFNTKEYSVIDMVNKYLEDTSKLTQEQIDALTAFKASLEN